MAGPRLLEGVLLLLLAGSPPGTVAQTQFDLSHMKKQPRGCFHSAAKYTPSMTGMSKTVDSLAQCQQDCRSSPASCAKFTYWPYTNLCEFSDSSAALENVDKGGPIAGYGKCPAEDSGLPDACTTELPRNGFPGISEDASNSAWPSGHQPQSMLCWPKDWVGSPMACKTRSVLEGTETGWPGKCEGLTKKADLFSANCGDDCAGNGTCAAWQATVDGECWQGVGYDCYVRNDFAPQAAQRLQHGKVRVLMSLAGWQILGLFQAFNNQQGFFETDEDAVNACRMTCYSDIRCQYWQYSPKEGCYVEDAQHGFSPEYPLTLDSARRDSSFALDCIGGEFVQHYCPYGEEVATANTDETIFAEACMKRGYRWEPNLNGIGQGRTVVKTAEACRKRCGQTKECRFFSFWPDGGCQLQDASATLKAAEDYRVVSGPAQCYNQPSTELGSTGHSSVSAMDWLTPEGREALTAHAVTGRGHLGPAPAPATTELPTTTPVVLGSARQGGGGGFKWALPLLICGFILIACVVGCTMYRGFEEHSEKRKQGNDSRAMQRRSSFLDSEDSEHSSYEGEPSIWEQEPPWPEEMDNNNGDPNVWDEEPPWPEEEQEDARRERSIWEQEPPWPGPRTSQAQGLYQEPSSSQTYGRYGAQSQFGQQPYYGDYYNRPPDLNRRGEFTV